MPQVSINIANRLYELACGEGEEGRVHELAAYVDDVHADLFFGDAQTFGQLAAHGERIFHRRPDLNAAIG